MSCTRVPQGRAPVRPVRSLRLCLAVLLLMALPAPGRAQGTITGHVMALDTRQPLVDARVLALGTNAAAVTDQSGKYTLTNVRAGSIDVQVLHVGYTSAKKTVTVTAGASTTADFDLAFAIVQLQEVVTTATGQQRKVELGSNIVTMGDVSAKLEATPVTTVSELFVGKVAGMTVVPGNNTGAPPAIRIRGLNSLSLNNAPIWIIDGVRMNASAIGSGQTTAATTNLTALDPQEIEDIEIVKGPSAATLYGTDAANGVIVVTTKRGKAGATHWTWNAEGGRISDLTKYINSYALIGHTSASPYARCLLIQVAAGTCTVDTTKSLNVLMTDSLSPLNVGYRDQYGTQASGGNDAIRFFVSGDIENETGPYKMPAFSVRRLDSLGTPLDHNWLRPEELQRGNFRVNMTAALSPQFDLAATAGFAKSDQHQPGANNGFFSEEYQSMTGPGFIGPGPGTSGKGALGENLMGYNSFVPSEMFQQLSQTGIQRIIGSLDAHWRPLTWLENDGLVGLDLADRTALTLCKYGTCPFMGTLRQGQSSLGENNDRNFSAKGTSTATWQARSWAVLKTTVGGDYTNIENDQATATGNVLPPGAVSPQAGANLSLSGTLATATKTLGGYVQEQASLRDRLFLTAAVRRDQNSAFGSNFQSVTYPKLSASWLASDESFFPKLSWLNQFRVRTAYGASGVQPGATAALITFQTASLNQPTTLQAVSGTDTPGLRTNTLGNANLKPETSAEFEGGFDTRLLNNRVNLELTYYSKQTHDALVAQPIAPSAAPASTTVLRNLGSVKNAGVEATITTTLLDRKMIEWDATISGSHLSNKVVSLGFDAAGNPNKTVGTGATRDSVSTSVNGLFYRTYTYDDADHNGYLSVSEVHVDSAFHYIGYSIPRDIVSILNSFDLLNRHLRINLAFDYKGGGSLLDQTSSIQCSQSNSCNGASDLNASLADQARNIADRNANPTTAIGYVWPNQFWRFREASAMWTLPVRAASLVRAQNLQLTFAARNLHLWTRYQGPDPEVTYTDSDTPTTYSTSGQRTYFILHLTLHY
ncbi:MAG TPA: SusC/RagA family TonB-linked outer membrane protein [Gemmatimonadaceae bacterium]|nr:SusC/RagA family TonB-linked outer membrane protein [Gemmatimonadaceae bacterium]